MVGHSGSVNPLAGIILSGEVVEVEIAVGFEAPDFAVFLTGVVGVNQVVGIPLGNFGFVVADVEGRIEVHFTEFVTIVDGEFPTA